MFIGKDIHYVTSPQLNFTMPSQHDAMLASLPDSKMSYSQLPSFQKRKQFSYDIPSWLLAG